MTQSRETAEATFAEAFEASLNFKTPEQGELLKGQIVSISGDDAFVSYGGPSEAVMATNELDGLDVGDTVEGTVVKTSPEIRISRKIRKASPTTDRPPSASGLEQVAGENGLSVDSAKLGAPSLKHLVPAMVRRA